MRRRREPFHLRRFLPDSPCESGRLSISGNRFMHTSLLDLSRSADKIEALGKLLADAGRKRLLFLMHNNPDPDTIASAVGLKLLFRKQFKVRSLIGYGGVITRQENRAMIQRLRIKMTQLSTVKRGQYYGIALVDTQPGAGNNLMEISPEPPLIVIDHHPLRKLSFKSPFHDIRPKYGATSTIVTEYLLAAGITPSRSVANALLYGIKSDTNSLARGACNVDFEAFNYLAPLTNPRVLGWIENPPLPTEYFRDYHLGLSHTTIYRDVAISDLGEIRSQHIVPELADLLLRIEGVSWSLCMARADNLLILSLRSTSRTYKAGTVVQRLIGKMGSAGGHSEMAAGQIPLEDLSEEDKDELARELVRRFLKLIGRQGSHPRPLVT